jgi:uncharacterized protein (DUF3084 family)
VEKEVLKCLDLMKEVEVEIGRKKAASARVKGLRGAIAAAGAEAAELEAQQQHLKRQMATLSDRIKRLESQVGSRWLGAQRASACKRVLGCMPLASIPCPRSLVPSTRLATPS